jgi:hypothetical protein
MIMLSERGVKFIDENVSVCEYLAVSCIVQIIFSNIITGDVITSPYMPTAHFDG